MMKATISASRTSPAATDNPTARPTLLGDDDDDAAADADETNVVETSSDD